MEICPAYSRESRFLRLPNGGAECDPGVQLPEPAGVSRPTAPSFHPVCGQMLHLVRVKSMVNLLFIHQFGDEMLPVMTEEFGFMRCEDGLLG